MQRYIELGEGYAEIFELEQLIIHNHSRIDRGIFLTYDDDTASFLLVMKPAKKNFQAIYTIFKGIQMTQSKQKYHLITSWLDKHDVQHVTFDTKNPDEFYEREQYYQYITGVLRLNHLIPPMH